MPRSRKREAVDATTILTALESAPEGKATAKELGSNANEMAMLEAAGIVVKLAETRKSASGRGRPSFLWTKAEGVTTELAAEVMVSPVSTFESKTETKAGRIATALAELQAGGNRHEGCQCVMVAEAVTVEELKHMQGCKDRWICSALVKLRTMV